MNAHNTMAIIGASTVLYVWIMAVGLATMGTLRNRYTAKDVAVRARKKLKWIFWPVYVPVYLVCRFFYLIYIMLRGAVRGIDDAQLFKKLDRVGERKGHL